MPKETPKTLAEINTLLGPVIAADLTGIIGEIKAAVRTSDAGVIADLEAKIAANTAAAEQAALTAKDEADKALAGRDATIQSITEKANEVVAKLTAQLDSSRDIIAKLTAERDAQVARAQALAKATKAIRDDRKAIDAREDALVVEASQGLDEQEKAKKEARRAALLAEADKLK